MRDYPTPVDFDAIPRTPAMSEELTPQELADWLRQTVAEAYHGADGTNPHHDFAECGDPFCTDAQVRLAQVLAVLRSTESEADPR